VRILCFAVIALLFMSGACSAGSGQALLIDDFENPVSAGPDGTVDFGSGGGSSLEVKAGLDIKYSGNQSLEAVYDAAAGGYMWIARGFELDSRNAGWLVKPDRIKWKKYAAISFYMYGNGSNSSIAFDIKDKGNELWRFMVTDDFKGWKKVVCPFKYFFCRGDWQPGSADKNSKLDFPLKSFQFEPKAVSKGTLYFDCVELTR